MGIKKLIPDIIKEQLDSAIADVVTEHKKDNEEEKIFSRNRILNMETMMKLLISMDGGSLQKELYNAGIEATASAFVQQRKKLQWTDFEKVLDNFNERCEDSQRYKGYRILAVDGTAINMPRNPKAESYICDKGSKKGYNLMFSTMVYDVLNKTYLHAHITPWSQNDEVGSLLFFLNWYDYPPKTLIVADRRYESYNIFANFIEKGVDFLVRIRQEKNCMRIVSNLPFEEFDKDIEFTITTTQRNIDKESGYIFLQIPKNKNRIYSTKSSMTRFDFATPYPMKIRVLRFMLDNGQYETLATSLPRSFSLQDIKELYRGRWRIENAFRELKYNLGLVNIHGKSDDFVKQEIFAAMIMSNFCSRIASQIVIKKKSKNILAYQVNWKMAVFLCKKFYRDKNGKSKQLLTEIEKYIEAVRPNRADERNLKVKSFVGFTYRVSS